MTSLKETKKLSETIKDIVSNADKTLEEKRALLIKVFKESAFDSKEVRDFKIKVNVLLKLDDLGLMVNELYKLSLDN